MSAQTASSHRGESVGFKGEDGVAFPSMILVASASPCNLKCPNCPCTVISEIRDTQDPEGKAAPYLAFEHYTKIADECKKYATAAFRPRLRISGYGEPLLNKRLMDMIRYSCALGVPTSLISNGTRLWPDLSEALLEWGIESIEISVDAHCKELYDQVRPGGDFGDLLANVRHLVNARNARPHPYCTKLIVSVVKSPLVKPHLDAIVNFWKEIGVDHVSVRKYLTWGLDLLRANQTLLDEPNYMSEDAPCPYPYERLMVDPAGWIRLCPYDDQKLIPDFGHVRDTDIASVWRGARFGAIRSCHTSGFEAVKAKSDAPLCSYCEDRRNRSWTFNYMSILGG